MIEEFSGDIDDALYQNEQQEAPEHPLCSIPVGNPTQSQYVTNFLYDAFNAFFQGNPEYAGTSFEVTVERIISPPTAEVPYETARVVMTCEDPNKQARMNEFIQSGEYRNLPPELERRMRHWADQRLIVLHS